MTTVTVACPEAIIPDANDLAMVLAFSPADELTYGALNWQDAAGNLYAAASFEARDEWVIGAQSELTRPEWDVEPYVVNMAAARRAQAALVFAQEGVDSTASTLTAIAGMDGLAALAAMGLTLVDASK